VRRLVSRAFALALLVPVTLLLGACVFAPDRAPFEVDGATRGVIALDVPAEYELAVWRSGPADAWPVIYVHGTPGSAGAFRSYLADPVEGTRSIAYDRPGFGETTPKRVVPSFQEQAAAIEPLLETGDTGERPILVGHSLGGPIVARAAADYPQRVGGLVILAGSLDPALEKPEWFNYLADFPLVRPFIGSALRHANDEIMSAREHAELLDSVIHRVTCPVVVIHGTRDSLVSYDNVEYMRTAFTNAESVRVITLEGVRHFIPWSHEQTVREAIESLIAPAGTRDEPGTAG